MRVERVVIDTNVLISGALKATSVPRRVSLPGEVGDPLRRHIHPVAGPGVAAPVRLAVPEAKAAEAAEFHFLPPAQRFHDAAEHGFDDRLGVLLREVGTAGHVFHEHCLRQATFGHWSSGHWEDVGRQTLRVHQQILTRVAVQAAQPDGTPLATREQASPGQSRPVPARTRTRCRPRGKNRHP